MRAKLTGQNGDEYTFKIYDKVTEEEKSNYKIDGELFATIEWFDPESITKAQQNHIYALIGDMAFYTGYPEAEWERYIKRNFMHKENLKELPSFAINKMSKNEARELIEYIIIFCIREEIPFRKNQFYLPRESSNFLYWATNAGMCVICGDLESDMHHATNLVGMGRNRNEKKHWHSTFLSLCRAHHNEAHNLGLTAFMEKYLVKPIKLNERQYNEVIENRKKKRRLNAKREY